MEHDEARAAVGGVVQAGTNRVRYKELLGTCLIRVR